MKNKKERKKERRMNELLQKFEENVKEKKNR